jgi:hypothetical protein
MFGDISVKRSRSSRQFRPALELRIFSLLGCVYCFKMYFFFRDGFGSCCVQEALMALGTYKIPN